MSVFPSVRRRLSGLCAVPADPIVLLVFAFAAVLLLAGHTPDAVVTVLGSLVQLTAALAGRRRNTGPAPDVVQP
ncbi:hypothetical protein [Amycolatopsis australiensis]|uniref:Uncharacterized protein n=1 Tax=Amycolatopsis australiensis TaxID=546364 RepID=A0A1K1QX68_9PSEU|nr:hypothetical protein [Amycolatopsis australiensis]SFW64381.1 hypothetical protein SAMN04489730_2345 [Amycolatopsis australiensis]